MFLLGRNGNCFFLKKEGKACYAKSVIAMATGTLYMLEKEMENAITVLQKGGENKSVRELFFHRSINMYWTSLMCSVYSYQRV